MKFQFEEDQENDLIALQKIIKKNLNDQLMVNNLLKKQIQLIRTYSDNKDKEKKQVINIHDNKLEQLNVQKQQYNPENGKQKNKKKLQNQRKVKAMIMSKGYATVPKNTSNLPYRFRI